MRKDFLGTSFIWSRNSGWWTWHIVPDRLWISWRYYANRWPLQIHWESRRDQ